MSTQPPETPQSVVGEVEETFCYGHPDTPTKLRCSRCDRPICGRCAIPASVGQHCPECVAEARKGQRSVKSALRATAPAVMTIIVINVAVFIAQNLVAGLTTDFASFPIAIANGEWWRLLTPMFLHSTSFIFHILMNMYVLYIFGPQVEQAFGTARFVVMYLVAGFFASAASYALGPCSVFGVGASGAIFGVVGVLLIYLYRRRSSQFVAGYLRQLLIFIGINAVLGFAIANIDMWAHAGGLLAGVMLGAGFDRGGSPQRARTMQLVTTLAVIGLGLAFAVYRTATFASSCQPFG
ncbi:MAG: rhomboid family intramembrane serine protease [Actinomycetota bacterium]|nr:rhomboid family intramembrane serine protease [Actinomycetota bacterium]